jgi:hypothetical protein
MTKFITWVLIEFSRLLTGAVNQIPIAEEKTEATWNVECGCFEERPNATAVLGIRN